MAANLITAEHPTKGTMFAAVDPTARFVTPAVSGTRLGARLAPYSNTAAALTALTEAGCTIEEGSRK